MMRKTIVNPAGLKGGREMQHFEWEARERVEAPADTLWEELWPLDHLLENVRTISSFEVSPDGRRASASGGLAQWPVMWREATGTAEVVEALTAEVLRWSMVIPSPELEFEGTFELTPAGAGETNLVYRGVLRCGDPHAGRLRHVLCGLLEYHLETVASRVATRAARRTSAARALGRA
jgi:uncharacterized membrane protein